MCRSDRELMSRYFRRGMRNVTKCHEKPSQDGRSPSRDFNPGPLEHEEELLAIRTYLSKLQQYVQCEGRKSALCVCPLRTRSKQSHSAQTTAGTKNFITGIIFPEANFFRPVNNFTALCPKTRFIKCHMAASPDYICHMRPIHTLAHPQYLFLR